MNIKYNKRRKQSQEKIEKTFVSLIQTKEIEDISVTEICTLCNINRSTFYANYIDIYDLAEKITEKMIQDFFELYKEERTSQKHSYDFLKLFKHIKENQLFYKTYFKLNLDFSFKFFPIDTIEAIRFNGSSKHLDYHVEFFKAGISAIIKKWLYNDCKESPEEIVNIIKTEYIGKSENKKL